MNQAAYFIRKTILSSKYGVFYLQTMDICPKTYQFRIILGQIYIAKAPKQHKNTHFGANHKMNFLYIDFVSMIILKMYNKDLLSTLIYMFGDFGHSFSLSHNHIN